MLKIYKTYNGQTFTSTAFSSFGSKVQMALTSTHRYLPKCIIVSAFNQFSFKNFELLSAVCVLKLPDFPAILSKCIQNMSRGWNLRRFDQVRL